MKRLALCLLAAVCLAAEDDIYARLRQAVGASAVEELQRGNFAKVEELLRAAHPAGAPARADLSSLQGAVAFMAGNMPAAAADFTQAATLAPLRDADTFTFAMALVKLREDQRARSLIETLARNHPDRALYLYWLGRLDYDQRRYQDATAELRKAVSLDPKSARAWDALGLALDMQGEMEQALPPFEKAVELNRSLPHPSPWPPHDLGFLLLRTNKPKDAEALLRESIRYDPTLAQSHYYLGRTLEKEGQDNAAIAEYVASVTSDTVSPEPCYSLALLYRKVHRDADARAMFAEYKRRKEASAK